MPANPFTGPDDRELWEILVHHDIEGFLTSDWSLCALDFLEQGFSGIDARFNSKPDVWELKFPTLDSYRRGWLEQSREFARERFTEDPREQLYRLMKLASIKRSGDSALVQKRFSGSIKRQDHAPLILEWQSLFICRKVGGRWKIAGFVGYLPNPSASGSAVSHSE